MTEILFIDDEDRRSRPWREALQEELHGVRLSYLADAEAAMSVFADQDRMAAVPVVVLDMAMYSPNSIDDRETDLGRITGEALRRSLRRQGWPGRVVVLTNSRDDTLRRQVENDGDHFLRKYEAVPSGLAELVAGLLPGAAQTRTAVA